MVYSINIPTTFAEAAAVASSAANAAYKAGSAAMDYAQNNTATVAGVASGVLFVGSLAGTVLSPPKNIRDIKLTLLGAAQVGSYVLGAAALILSDQQAAKKK